MSDWSFSSDDSVSEPGSSDDGDDFLLSMINKPSEGLKLSLNPSLAPSKALKSGGPGDDFDIALPPIFSLVASLNDKVHEADQVLTRKLLDDENRIKQEYSDLIAHKQKILLELNSTGSRTYSLSKDSDLLNDLVYQDRNGTLHRRYYFFSVGIAVDPHRVPYNVLPVPTSPQLLDCFSRHTPRQWLIPLAHYVLAQCDNLGYFDVLCNAFVDMGELSSINGNYLEESRGQASASGSCEMESGSKSASAETLTALTVPLPFSRYMDLISSPQSGEMPLVLPRPVPGVEISLARAQLIFAIGLATAGFSPEMLVIFIRIACDFGARKHAFPRLAHFVCLVFPALARSCSALPEKFFAELSRIRTSENSEYSPLRQHDYQLQFSVLELLNVCLGPSQHVLTEICSINCSFLAGRISIHRGTPAVSFFKPIFRALAASLSNIQVEVTLDFYLCYYKIRLLDYILAQPFSVADGLSVQEQLSHIVNVASLLGQLHAKTFSALKNIGLSATNMSPPLRQRLVQCLTDASTRLLRLHTRFHAIQVLALPDIFYG